MSIYAKNVSFLVPGDRDALLGMSDIGLLNILQFNFNTIGTKKEEKGLNYKQNKKNIHQCGKRAVLYKHRPGKGL